MSERNGWIGALLLVLVVLVPLTAWAPATGESPQAMQAAAEAERQAMQAAAEAERQALLATDRGWAAAARAGDVDEVVSFWTDDARVMLPGRATVEGKAAIRRMVEEDFATEGFEVSWEPAGAEVGGALGYTWGHSESTMPDEGGDLVTTHGRYLAVWRKQGDGTWKCVMDFVNEAPMP